MNEGNLGLSRLRLAQLKVTARNASKVLKQAEGEIFHIKSEIRQQVLDELPNLDIDVNHGDKLALTEQFHLYCEFHDSGNWNYDTAYAKLHNNYVGICTEIDSGTCQGFPLKLIQHMRYEFLQKEAIK